VFRQRNTVDCDPVGTTASPLSKSTCAYSTLKNRLCDSLILLLLMPKKRAFVAAAGSDSFRPRFSVDETHSHTHLRISLDCRRPSSGLPAMAHTVRACIFRPQVDR